MLSNSSGNKLLSANDIDPVVIERYYYNAFVNHNKTNGGNNSIDGVIDSDKYYLKNYHNNSSYNHQHQYYYPSVLTNSQSASLSPLHKRKRLLEMRQNQQRNHHDIT